MEKGHWVEVLSELDKINQNSQNFAFLDCKYSRFVETLIELFELLKALKFNNQPVD